MSFRYWLEEITRIRLEDVVREAGLGPLDLQYLVPVRTGKKQGKEVEVKSTQPGWRRMGSIPASSGTSLH